MILRTHDIVCFNPRSYTGSDKFVLHPNRYYRCFNPRSYTGSDI